MKLLPVIDELTPVALALDVGHRFTCEDLIGVLAYLTDVRGAP